MLAIGNLVGTQGGKKREEKRRRAKEKVYGVKKAKNDLGEFS